MPGRLVPAHPDKKEPGSYPVFLPVMQGRVNVEEIVFGIQVCAVKKHPAAVALVNGVFRHGEQILGTAYGFGKGGLSVMPAGARGHIQFHARARLLALFRLPFGGMQRGRFGPGVQLLTANGEGHI